MAVSRTGTGLTIQTSVVDSSNAVTVPVATDVVVVGVEGWVGTAGTSAFDELNWDSGRTTQDFVDVGTSFYSGDNPIAGMFYMARNDTNWPGTGAQTLYWVWHGASISEGLNIHVDFYTGVDISNPMVDSDTADYGGSPQSLATTGGGADDMFVCVAYGFNTAPAMDDGTQTEIESSTFNGSGIGFGEEQGVNSFTVTAGASVGLVGMVLRAALIPVVTDVDGDEAIDFDQTNVVVTGTDFESPQGTGILELSDNAVYATGTKVTQSIDTWADTSIQFDVTIGGLVATTLYLWVTNDQGQRQVTGTALTVTYLVPPVITDVEDEVFTVYETDIVLTGTDLGTQTGPAKLELGDSATYGSATLSTQTIDSWANTSIQFDLTIGALDQESLWLYVTDSIGTVSAPYAVLVGLAPTISNVDGDNTITSIQFNVSLNGDTFLNAKGTGKIELSDNIVYATGTKVLQTTSTWTDSVVLFNVQIGSLTDTTLYAWHTNDLGFRSAPQAVTVSYPPVVPVIGNIEDETFAVGETGIVMTGTGFLAPQGIGKVEITDNAVYASGNKVEQTIVSWIATIIAFDLEVGAIAQENMWMWVTNSTSEISLGTPVTITGLPISDGLWKAQSFQGSITALGFETTIFMQRDE